jgi:hypothetical protein
MISKARAILDDGFLVGLAFALFLAGKIVPFLLVVGVLPIALFWMKSDYAKPAGLLARFLLPTIGYLAFCLLLLYAYPGLQPGETPPNNPDLELYAVAFALLAVGFLRGQQIRNLSNRFHIVMPWALLAAFAVLSIYMFLGWDGCRVQVAASWPFIPAIIFTTLTFLLLLGWQGRSTRQRFFRLALITLSIIVTVAYTGSRGVAVGQFAVLAALILCRGIRSLRNGLPTMPQLGLAIGAGLALCAAVGTATGCNSFGRWHAVINVADILQPATRPASALPETELEPVLVSDSVPSSIPSSTPAQSNDASISLRLDMWRASLDAIRQAPLFGHGALSLRPIIQDPFGFEHNHNQYLAWLVTGGIVLLVIGLFFLSTPALISSGLAPADRVIVILSVTGLWGVSMIFDAFLSLDFYLHYFSLLLAFLFALITDMAKSQRPQNG